MKNIIDRPHDLSCSNWYLLLSGLLLLALVLRILALLSLKESIYFDFLLWDERLYHDQALNILNGAHGSRSLYAFLMALIYKLFSPDIFYIRILNSVLGVLTCYLIYLIGKGVGNRSTGLFACAIAALYEPFIFYSIVPLKTSLSLFLFASTVILFIDCLENTSFTRALLLGMAAGLLFNVRPNFIVIISFLPLFLLYNGIKMKASFKKGVIAFMLYATGLSVAVVPFGITKGEESGKSKQATSQSQWGLNLYIGNNIHNPDPYYLPAPFAVSSPREQAIQFTIEASRRLDRKLSTAESSFYWTGEVVRMAVEDPGAFIRKICLKTLVLFNRFEAGDHYHIEFMSDFISFFRLPFLSFWLILPFGMAGMAVTLFGSRKLQSLFLILFLYGATLILFFTTTRYRLPLLVLLIPFSVLGMAGLLNSINKRRFKNIRVYTGVAVAFLIIEFLPVQGTGDMTAYYNTHAIILYSRGLGDEAVKYWERSSGMNGIYSAFANLALAGNSIQRRDIQKAFNYLEMIPDDSFAAAQKYDMIGDIRIYQGQPRMAISAYNKSLKINTGQRATRRKLIKSLWKTDRQSALKEHDKLEYISSFYGSPPG
ncbi:MAG: glycosyltransferase family 39 protein [Pseudomonadota bacterium]